MQIVWAVFQYNIKNLLRNFKSAGIMFVLPVVFMGVFALAFGQSTTGLDIKLGLIESESLETMQIDLKQIFEDIDIDKISLKVNTFDSVDDLKRQLEENKINIGIEPTSAEGIGFKVYGNADDPSFLQNKSFVQDVLLSIAMPDQSVVDEELIGQEVNSTSVFDAMVPGLIIYGLLILIPGIAQSFTEITEKEYIFRFANSKATATHIILGTIAYYMLLSVIQVILLFMTATIFGYEPAGNVLAAAVPALSAALFVIGLGLLIGSFVKKTDAATNIGTILSIILGFFSGSFIAGIGQVLEVNLFGNTYQFNDFLPSKWATVAIEKIMAENRSLSEIGSELTIILVSGLVISVIGIVVYKRNQLDSKAD